MLPRAILGRRPAALLCAAAAGVSVLAACSSGSSKPAAAPSPSASPSPTPRPAPPPLLATLNGLPPAKGPIVVIKVDNATSARPLQKGFARAPVVYQEIIEGEATRFAAVFVGGGSPEVGPIRSARDTDIDFRFGTPNLGGTAVHGTTTVLFNGASYVTFHYDARRHGFVLTQNGRTMRLADGNVVAPQNVVVQFVPVVRGKYHDVLGNNSPDTHSIGTGRAVVFRDGRRYDGRWRRPSRSAGTHFLTPGGTDIRLRSGGQTWVLLVPTNGRITGS